MTRSRSQKIQAQLSANSKPTHQNPPRKKTRTVPYVLVPPFSSQPSSTTDLHNSTSCAPESLKIAKEEDIVDLFNVLIERIGSLAEENCQLKKRHHITIAEKESDNEMLRHKIVQLETQLQVSQKIRTYLANEQEAPRKSRKSGTPGSPRKARHVRFDLTPTNPVIGDPEDAMEVDIESEKSHSLDLRTTKNALKEKLQTSLGFYQTLVFNREMMPEDREATCNRLIVVITIFATKHEALNVRHYDLANADGFLRFLQEQMKLTLSPSLVERMNTSDDDIFRVYTVDLTTSENVEMFLKAISHLSRIVRLGPACGMEITLPSTKPPSGIPMSVDFVPKSTSPSELKDAISASVIECTGVEVQSYVGDSQQARVFIHADPWSNDDASSLLWAFATEPQRIAKTRRAIYISGRYRYLSRIEYCCFCGYDCLIRGFPHTPDCCGLLQSLRDSGVQQFVFELIPRSRRQRGDVTQSGRGFRSSPRGQTKA
ncbi:hypothetical protein VNI00_008664 [Paramarasmius palmivorus]|uniref:Uncharacterized protein n=1 Tax=Paramarasmius palmivorus TaxID=297713 RepID=A0AAW0CWS7_9AGAR